MTASNNTLEGKSISTSLTAQMPNIREEKDKNIVDRKLAKLLILDSICSDAIQSPFFNNFVKGVAEYGPGYELPSSLTLKSLIMPGIKKEVEEYVQNVKKYSIKTGCTLMYNIWPSRKSGIKTFFTYKKIFAYTPRGLACMDPSEYPMDELFLFEEAMSSIVEEIGPRHVVKFITNNDSDDSVEIRSTKDMLKKYPWIYMTNCATHGIGLLLKKIYFISFVYNTIEVAKLIVTYIYRHNVSVPLRRVHKRKNDYISFNICLLISLLEVEDELQALQVSIITLSTDWGRMPNYKQVGDLLKGARLIDHAIHCKEFWIRGKKIAQVDGDGATSGYLYEMIERVKDAIMQCS